VSIIAQKAGVSANIPVSALDYTHTLLTVDMNNEAGRLDARKKLGAAGFDVCFASSGDTGVLMPWLLKGSEVPYVLYGPADPRISVYGRWQPYEHYGALWSAATFTLELKEFLQFYPDALKARAHVFGNSAPPPADIDFAAREKKETRTIMSAGRFREEDKQFSALLRAFALLYREFPRWRLKIVGDGPHWDFYRVIAEQLSIRQVVEFTGSTADMKSQYESADIFCLPTFRREGLPMVFLEASAYALPLVGYESLAAASALITPETGVLAKSGEDNTPEALAEALRSLMLLPPRELVQTGINCRDHIQRHYGGNIILDQWEKLFTQISERRTPMIDKIGPEWEGLTPDSEVWTEAVLTAAAAEITARENPFETPEYTGEDAENLRLKCELARVKQDYAALEKNTPR